MSILGKIKFKGTSRQMLYETRHIYTTAMHQYINHCIYVGGSYYIVYPKSFTNRMDVVLWKLTGRSWSGGNVVITGITGENDGHALPCICADNDGYLYIAKQQNDIGVATEVYKSDNPLDLLNFTKIATIDTSIDEHPYPKLAQLGTNVYLFCRDSFDSTLDFGVVSTGMSMSSLIDIASSYKSYVHLVRDESNNRITLLCGVLDDTDFTMYRVGVITTTDGTNWGNWDGTWSKDVSAGKITEAEFITNCCLVNDATRSNHYFPTDSFIKNGNIYILVEEGAAAGGAPMVDYVKATIRYYDDGWQSVAVPATVTGMPYNYDLTLETRLHLGYNSDGFVLLKMANTNYNNVTKYTSSDMSSWGEGEVVMTSQSPMKFGLYGTCKNKEIVIFGYNTPGTVVLVGGDPCVYDYT